MKPRTKTIVIIAASAAAVALAAWLYYRYRRRLTQLITLGYASGTPQQGDAITGAVRTVTDTIRTTLGMQYFTISELCASTTPRHTRLPQRNLHQHHQQLGKLPGVRRD